MVVRRVIGVMVGSAAVAVGLSGCILPIDAAQQAMIFTNDSSRAVVVVVEGLSDEYPQLVVRESSYGYGLDECLGTGIRVETESGELIGRVDAQACPDWTLTVNEDGTLDYAEVE